MMFLIGLWDDFMDLPAKLKFVLQILASLILLYFGVGVDTLRILGWAITNPWICGAFTVLWVVGITNAINLLDGLDGLCGGMILVVLSIVCAISIVDRRGDIVLLSLILMGSILGFLLYNAHPASIFMGDCGSLFLGSMIASISLLGFKSSTIMTLGFPILILLLPIIDTFSAILRRKIKKIPVDQADKSHLHHQLMRRFGQTNSVIIMCGMTFGFGMSAFLYIYDRTAGLMMMIVLVGVIELFIERTGMISNSFHPVHSTYRVVRKGWQKAAQPLHKLEDEMHRKQDLSNTIELVTISSPAWSFVSEKEEIKEESFKEGVFEKAGSHKDSSVSQRPESSSTDESPGQSNSGTNQPEPDSDSSSS